MIIFEYQNKVLRNIDYDNPPLVGETVFIRDNKKDGDGLIHIAKYRVKERIVEVGYFNECKYYPNSLLWRIYLEDYKKSNID